MQFVGLMKVYFIGATLSVQTIIVNYFRLFFNFVFEGYLFLAVAGIEFNGWGFFCLYYFLGFGFGLALFDRLLFFVSRFSHPQIDKYYKN